MIGEWVRGADGREVMLIVEKQDGGGWKDDMW